MIEFAQPAALWTSLAIGLPLLAHMAYRRVTEKFYFPSLRFIRPSQIPRTGKRRPSDIPLLLLRILLFLIISALLADPYWKSETLPIVENQRDEVFLAIDLSPSMAGWNGLEEAKEKALAIIKEEKGKVGLVTFGHSTLEKIDIGQENLSSKIENLTHDWTRGNAQVMLDRVSSMFTENATSRKLIILSDFQQSDWQTAYTNLDELGISYELVKVGQTNAMEGRRANNISIMEARAVPAGPDKIRIWSVVRNWDDVNKTIDVELIAGEKVKASESVSISPLGSAQVQFVLKEGDFSEAVLRLAQSDEFGLDNERVVWLKAPPARRFGFWMPELEDDETDEEKSFLKTAVASAGDNGWNRWELDQDQADGLRLGDDQLNVEILMVLAVGRWFEDEQLGEPLKDFLNKGGVVLTTPGEPFSSSVSVLKSNDLLEYNFVRVAGGAARTRNPFRIGALPEDSKLADVFAGKSARDLYLSAIHKFGILKAGADTGNTEVPLRDREGRPLVLVKNFDEGGKFVFLPFRMNTGWTDLPLRNSFLPLLMELTQGKESQQTSRAWPILEPGEDLVGNQGHFRAVEPGAYRYENQWIEVVLSPAECTPATLSLNEISESFGGDITGSKVHPQDQSKSEEENNPLWMWFAIAAAILLTIEMIWSRPNSTPSPQTDPIHA
ncbi:MAG: hypothetical protein HOI70_05910 [Opitutae bacterium]|nr:hypothetical protein [Opitutae bacterium]